MLVKKNVTIKLPVEDVFKYVFDFSKHPKPGGKFWLDRQIQPSHIVNSTQGKKNDDKKLRTFLDSFATPDII